MLSKQQARDSVNNLLQVHSKEVKEFEYIHDYLRPWTPSEAARKLNIGRDSRNYEIQKRLAAFSQSPFLSLVLDTYSQTLKVSGYYRSDGTQSDQWKCWNRNSMNARQTGIHRNALAYGTSYATALPAKDGLVKLTGHSPRRFVALYGDNLGIPGISGNEAFPILALEIGRKHLRLYDEEAIYTYGIENKPEDALLWSDRAYLNSANLPLIDISRHDLGVAPVVRYQDRFLTEGEEGMGIIRPLIDMADRINETNYEQAVAQYFGAFKQRYVVGFIPESEEQALRQNVAITQFFEDPDVKVGQYEESQLDGYIQARRATIQDLAAVAQVPAQALGAQAISNVSADGLAALETSKDRKAAEIQTSLGESHEQLLRLVAHIQGDSESAGDFESEIRWEETSARSFAQTVDGLGKIATLLGVPKESLWEDIPGWTSDRVDRTKKVRDQSIADYAENAGIYFDAVDNDLQESE